MRPTALASPRLCASVALFPQQHASNRCSPTLLPCAPSLPPGGKLRDVPAFEHSRQLAADAAALALPAGLQAALQAALPLNQQQGLADVPSCRGVAAQLEAGRGSGSGSALSLDPWPLLEGGTEGGGAGSDSVATAAAGRAVPPWLEGAVKRRRRDMCFWPAPPASGAPLLSIEQQLQRREDRLQRQASDWAADLVQ